ncbi:MAG: transcription elongation factor GreA [Piscirickettsiaceae bacterium]|nr:transcription elongation factor GreA [Piscirickettsiaceae bacterium]
MAVPMTLHGLNKLKNELQHLKFTVRSEVVVAISEARAHGDLKENSEYHSAKEQQSFVEGRIQELEVISSNVQIIDPTMLPRDGRVVFGVTVDLFNIGDEDKVTYQIVGDYESDVKLHRISISSPIARAIIGKEINDIAIVQAPSGPIDYEIVAIIYKG